MHLSNDHIHFFEQGLTAMSNQARTDWPELLGPISLSYRSCIYPATGEIPFFLERGRDPRLAQETAVTPVGDDPVEVHEWRSAMRRRMEIARKLAAENDSNLIRKN